MSQAFSLADFVRESNRIEGIHREPHGDEIYATRCFLDLKAVHISSMVDLVRAYQQDARPRFVQGLDVRVGRYFPPRGGPDVQRSLQHLLKRVSDGTYTPWYGHVEYETLHPFTDGNGRSGRALWLWAMGGMNKAQLGFLHHWYYQSLQNAR